MTSARNINYAKFNELKNWQNCYDRSPHAQCWKVFYQFLRGSTVNNQEDYWFWLSMVVFHTFFASVCSQKNSGNNWKQIQTQLLIQNQKSSREIRLRNSSLSKNTGQIIASGEKSFSPIVKISPSTFFD